MKIVLVAFCILIIVLSLEIIRITRKIRELSETNTIIMGTIMELARDHPVLGDLVLKAEKKAKDGSENK